MRIDYSPNLKQLCKCGCGNQTPISKYTRPHLGHIKGQPITYINFHFRTKGHPQTLLIKHPVKVNGIDSQRCIGCKDIKPLIEFAKDKNRPYGRDPRCKKCLRIASKIYSKTPKAIKSARITTKRWRTRNPEKVKAHSMLNEAIARQLIKRLPCEICGNNQSDGHHDDYSKPLEVIWLCRIHHKQRHELMR